MELLEEVKTDLRISFDDLDEDIESNIAAALLDLGIAGVATAELDALSKRAVKLFCRWQYNFDGRADKYAEAYHQLKITLSLDLDHKEAEE